MLGNAALDALERIASRAQDLRDAYRPGAIPANADVRTAGSVAPTTDPLSVVASPGAWFLVRAGSGEQTFTRDGALCVRDGTLCTTAGAAVLGYPNGEARRSAPVALQIAAADRALGRAADLHVERDGTVAYTRAAIDPRSGARTLERVTVGRVALARFPAGSAPVRIDATRFAAPSGVAPHLGAPDDGTFPGLATSSRDAGALDLDAGIARLNDAYVAFEALSAATRAHGATAKTALDLVK
jgi:flagellar basal body rod protein FlgG